VITGDKQINNNIYENSLHLDLRLSFSPHLSIMLPHIISLLDILNVSSPTSMNCSVNPQAHDNEENIKSLVSTKKINRKKVSITHLSLSPFFLTVFRKYLLGTTKQKFKRHYNQQIMIPL
jgi:hypothetical protein